jgi:hypothetical protein
MSKSQHIFDAACKDRLAHPLANGGLYKVREAADRLHRASRNIDQLIAYHHNRSGLPFFTSCSWSDKAPWLRGALSDIPTRLGYEIMPGLRALVYDGISKEKINAFEISINSQLKAILSQVDAVFNEIKSGISIEYKNWDSHRSLIQSALNSGVNLADDIVRFAERELSLHEVTEI